MESFIFSKNVSYEISQSSNVLKIYQNKINYESLHSRIPLREIPVELVEIVTCSTYALVNNPLVTFSQTYEMNYAF